MVFLIEAMTFPAIVLPAFIALVFVLAILLRHRKPQTPWVYRDVVLVYGTVLAISCAVLALVSAPHSTSDLNAATAASAPCIEVDMLVSGGNGVDLYFNDWQHPPERLPVIPGRRSVYRFSKLPEHITLVRLDPTDAANARMVLYGLTVKRGNETVRRFGPAELKQWNLINVSAAQDQDGGLAMLDTNDDPILWAPVSIRIPKPVEHRSVLQRYKWPLSFAGIAVVLIMLILVSAAKGPLTPFLTHGVRMFPGRFQRFATGTWAGVLVVVLTAGATIYLTQQSAKHQASIDVDMMVSRGIGVDLFVNDWNHAPERLPVAAGQRHVYRFVNIPREIDLLRLDPTDQRNAQVILYGVVIRSGDHVVQQFGPAELKFWTRTNISEPKEKDGGLSFTDLNDDPVLITPLALQMPGGIADVLSPLVRTNDSVFLLAMTVFLVILLCRMFSGEGRGEALLIASISLVVAPVTFLIKWLNVLPPPPVASAIGYTNYRGYGKANEYLAVFIAMLVCITMAWAMAKVWPPLQEKSAAEEFDCRMRSTNRRTVCIAHAAVFALIFLYFWPDLEVMLNVMKVQAYQRLGWDDSIALHWSAMINAGLRPFRDFWYPYSGFYLQSLPAPKGVTFIVLQNTIVLWVFYWTVFRIAGQRLAYALIVFGLVFGPVVLNMVPGWYRYLFAVDVALFYAATNHASRFGWKQLAFAAFVGYAFFYEPTQVAYAAAAIAVHVLLLAATAVQGSKGFGSALARGAEVLQRALVLTGVPMLAGIAGSLLVFAVNGMLPGLWAFERSIGDQKDYGGFPADIVNWAFPSLRSDTVFLLMFFLASYAVYRWIRLEDSRRDPLTVALVVLCAATFMAMQKQILRPHAMSQVRLFPYAAALVFGLMVWRERRPAPRILILVFLGCVLGIAVNRNVFADVFRRTVQQTPSKLSGSMKAILYHAQDFSAVDRTLYSRSRFAAFDIENAVIDTLTQRYGLTAHDSVFVLSDNPIFYMLLNEQPPYVSNAYNDSPIYEQQKVLEWLRRKNPKFVIWQTDPLDYDSVPNSVRLPLIYTYIVERYQFVQTTREYHMLVRRAPDQPPNAEYWRSVLGDAVDLASIPALARISEYKRCNGDVAACDAVLTVRYGAHAPAGKVALDLKSAAGAFRIQFDAKPSRREYVVNLNRLWFWKLVSAKAFPRITAEDAAAEVKLQYLRERKPVLY